MLYESLVCGLRGAARRAAGETELFAYVCAANIGGEPTTSEESCMLRFAPSLDDIWAALAIASFHCRLPLHGVPGC